MSVGWRDGEGGEGGRLTPCINVSLQKIIEEVFDPSRDQQERHEYMERKSMAARSLRSLACTTHRHTRRHLFPPLNLYNPPHPQLLPCFSSSPSCCHTPLPCSSASPAAASLGITYSPQQIPWTGHPRSHWFAHCRRPPKWIAWMQLTWQRLVCVQSRRFQVGWDGKGLVVPWHHRPSRFWWIIDIEREELAGSEVERGEPAS